MSKLFTTTFFALLLCLCWNGLSAQSGCPGCEIMLPADLPEDTIYLSPAPDGRVGDAYAEDLSFRLPKTTTPVSGPDTPPDLPISNFVIDNVIGLPPGLSWEANQLEFMTSDTTDGCVQLCGTPLAPGLYEVEVVVTATVVIFAQTTSFSFPILIEPAVSDTDGFSIVNPEGCGSVTAAFINNLPANGQDGYSYFWDFGNGNTSTEEDPAPQIYTEPGIYNVQYQAVIDTAGFFLTQVMVHDVSCSDIFSAPDLKLNIFDPNGDHVFTTDIIDNTNPPVQYDLLIPIDTGFYTLQVIDDDGGIDGSDTECALVSFSQTQTGTFTTDDFSLTIELIHPVDTLQFTEQVTVYEQPTAPGLFPVFEQPICTGDTGVIFTDYDEGTFQWYLDSMLINDATNNELTASLGGDYYLVYTSPEGCIATSDILMLDFGSLPAGVILTQADNLLTLADSTLLPASYEVRWSLDGETIADEGLSLCAQTSGEYVIAITDLASGCSSTDTVQVVYDPDIACSTPTTEAPVWEDWSIYPNPSNGYFYLVLPNTFSTGTWSLFGAQGQHLREGAIQSGTSRLATDDLAAGVYLIKVQDENGGVSYRRWIKN